MLSGEFMSKVSKSLVTVAIIFGTAFILAAVGCSESSKTVNPNAGGSPGTDQNGLQNGGSNGSDGGSTDTLKPVDPETVKLCSDSEMAQINQWRNQVDKANGLIDQTGANETKWKKSDTAIKESVLARKMCQSQLSYQHNQPCKFLRKTIVNPNPKVEMFDEYHVNQKCLKSTKYANQFGPANVEEPVNNPNQPPVLPQPAPMPNPDQSKLPVDAELPSCSAEEFSALSEWSTQLGLADKSISKMGDNVSSWKYDANAIGFATQSGQSCEKLIQYHSAKPCQRNIKQNDGSVLNRVYSAETLAKRCERSRSYFYEFQQHTTTLMVRNAYLFIDMTGLSQNVFEPNAFFQNDNCIIENRTASTIDYSTQKAMVKDTRGFESKMMVLETTEGLVIQCYGLELDGPFSKNEVVRLLKAKNTNLKLEYILK